MMKSVLDIFRSCYRRKHGPDATTAKSATDICMFSGDLNLENGVVESLRSRGPDGNAGPQEFIKYNWYRDACIKKKRKQIINRFNV